MIRLKVFILTFSLLFYFPTYSFAYTEYECAQLASKAKNELAAKAILNDCSSRDSFFSKNKNLKCAIEAGEAKTNAAARELLNNYCYK